MEELKPCPFCGSEARLVEGVGVREELCWRVECRNCGAKIHSFTSKENTVGLWNSRIDASRKNDGKGISITPGHYQGKRTIDKQEYAIARLAGMGVTKESSFCAATAIKYLDRAGTKKSESFHDDMDKAINYIYRSMNDRWPWEIEE